MTKQQWDVSIFEAQANVSTAFFLGPKSGITFNLLFFGNDFQTRAWMARAIAGWFQFATA